MNKCIMAVYSHADDIECNAGGTILKYLAKGYHLIYVMSTNNMSGCWNSLDADGNICSRKVPWYEIMPQRKRRPPRPHKNSMRYWSIWIIRSVIIRTAIWSYTMWVTARNQ